MERFKAASFAEALRLTDACMLLCSPVGVGLIQNHKRKVTQVAQIQEDLSQRIRSLEKELQAALDEKERAFRYRWERGKAKFEDEVLSQHRKLKLWLPSYIRQSRFLAVVTAPIIYLGFIPFLPLLRLWRRSAIPEANRNRAQ